MQRGEYGAPEKSLIFWVKAFLGGRVWERREPLRGGRRLVVEMG
jgi:hypothetical protein